MRTNRERERIPEAAPGGVAERRRPPSVITVRTPSPRRALRRVPRGPELAMASPATATSTAPTGVTARRAGTYRLTLAARLVLGLMFLASGIFGLVVPPPPLPPDTQPGMVALFTGLTGSYLLTLVKLTEAAVGALLLANRFVPLALLVLAPVTVNIVLVHLLLAPSGLPIALTVLALHLFLGWSYRGAYRTVLAARVAPG